MNREAQNMDLAIVASDVEERLKKSSYPEPFFERMSRRKKRVLGDLFGIRNFGVNLTELLPGGESSIMHRHTKQEEFVFILSGNPTLVTDQGEIQLKPGMCAGFRADGVAHQLVNRSSDRVTYLEIGDRSMDDTVAYPNDDLQATLQHDGSWTFTRKDGRSYQDD